MYTVVKSVDIPIYYKRKIFSADDPLYTGIFAVDFVVPPYHSKESIDNSEEQLFLNEGEPLPRTTYYTKEEADTLGSNDAKPMLITLHGLSGGSHEIYLREVLEPMVKRGWEACVVNARGCAGSQITSGVLFNARATWDVRQVVRWCREKFPNRPLFAIGYSLGANILVNVGSLLRSLYTVYIYNSLLYHPTSILIHLIHSTSGKKEKIASSKLQRYVRIRGTLTQPP